MLISNFKVEDVDDDYERADDDDDGEDDGEEDHDAFCGVYSNLDDYFCNHSHYIKDDDNHLGHKIVWSSHHSVSSSLLYWYRVQGFLVRRRLMFE